MKRAIVLAFATAAAVAVAAVPALGSTSDSADLGVAVSADHSTYKVGDLVTYTVTVTNHGTAEADDVQVSDLLPTGMQLVSVSESRPFAWTVDAAVSDLGLSAATGSRTLTAADAYSDPRGLDAGPYAGRTHVNAVIGHLASESYATSDLTTATVTIVARATTAGTISNEASVSAANPDPDTWSNNYAATAIVVAA
jgi:uncharacterized repeat protein (TIGR01451 family)